MNSIVHITLTVEDEVRARLDRLRIEFARACNWVVPIAQANHCWNRVALHHLTYHSLREAFPDLGSQMACNAIYSVCRSYRLLLGHPQSPFFGKKLIEGQLPQIFFLNHSPVFFDSSHWFVCIGICFLRRVPGFVVDLPRFLYCTRVG